MTGAELAPATPRLAELERAAADYVATQRPRNTIRAYAADWRAWQEYTAEIGIPESSDTAGALVGFVAWLENRGAAPSTIDRRLGGVVVGLRARGANPPKAASESARAALNGYRRRLAEAGEKRGRGQAPALTVKDLRTICAACPDTLAGIRDRALVLLAFGIAGRRSEVASLLVSDIVDQPEGLVVTVRFGKTGARTVAVPYGSHEGTCPVRAWRRWRTVAGLVDGPAFRRINRHDQLQDGGLSGQAVGEVINRAAARAGLTVRYTGHSARAGLATEARRAGHDAKTIAAQGGWSPTSAVLHGYMRVVDQWADNAVAGIGL
ncbi:site-specific integrase [Amycolatopsis sp. NPDC006131]|uniref:site-specific integrase n=1 Tax=Amycolatopsis sp. NPDC006131 TaxID=3156731 RepID=UPI0033B55224